MSKTPLLSFALASTFTAFGAPTPANPSGGVWPADLIDLHCHTAGLGAGDSGCFISPEMQRSYKFRRYLDSFGVTERQVVAQGDGIIVERIAQQLARSRHVRRAVVLAMDGAVGADGQLDFARTELYVPNQFVAREVAKHPNLLFGASVNPYRKDAIERLRWAKENGAVLVKWLPSIMHIDPADVRLIPFYRALVELELPLLTHTGAEKAFTRAEDAYCDPERLTLALEQGVTIIAAHAATSGEFEGESSVERLARLMPRYPRLYADISSLTQINKRRYLPAVLKREEFRGRLVYGTDYPLINMKVLVSSGYHLRRIGWKQARAIARIENPWDRDVRLKQALGFDADVWTRGESLVASHATSGASQSVARTAEQKM